MDVMSVAQAAAAAAPSSNTATASANAVDKLANEQTFLQMFVAQLQNQDPLNPADGTQFVTQLAQFSSLEQLISINQGISALNTNVTQTSTPTTTPTTPPAATSGQ